ncbi:MAG: leucine-rich repeat protein [Erysipelotrichales bacterium]|nr:leucine-rich repeat protein [Erysipelotrichales bacterium]
MINKIILLRVKTVVARLVCFLTLLFIGITSQQLNLYAQTNALEERQEEQQDFFSNDIRTMLQSNDAFGFKRTYNPDSGPTTSYLPIAEIFGDLNLTRTNSFQETKDFNYNVRTIIGENRECSESIVLVLLGDGFTVGNEEGQMGYWPNPAPGTFLRSAIEFSETLTTMYPFSLFSDIFKIYAVETPSTQSGINIGTFPYEGTYFGTHLRRSWDLGIRRITHALEISNWVSANVIMTQVIANSEVGGGVAFGAGAGYDNLNTLGVTTRFSGEPISGWNRPVYHNLIIHEIGHNFGRLSDEHSMGIPNLGRANVASAADSDENLKWGHWLGHEGIMRRTQNAPVGFIFPSTNNTCIMQGWRATFSAVSNAELVRRMAIISGETFLSGRLPNGDLRNVTANLSVSGKRILPYAFHGNRSIQSITIPATVTEIGQFAFLGATGLRTITNQAIVPQQINKTTFAGAGSHEVQRNQISVIIPDGSYRAYREAGWTGFNLIEGGLQFELISGTSSVSVRVRPGTVLAGNVMIPESVIIDGTRFSVTEIAANGFANQNLITEITIPASINNIAINAFANTNLKVNIAEGMLSIPNRLFENTGIRNINIPNSVTSIGERAFYNTSLQTINFEANSQLTHIGSHAFSNTALWTVTIPRNVIQIGDFAFANIMNFNELTFENGSKLQEIGIGAFRGNHILRNVELPEGVRFIGFGAFAGNTGLESITIPFIGQRIDNQTNSHFGFIFGALMYQNQNNFIPNRLRVVTITGNSRIFDYAFFGCENIITVEIPDNLTQIDINAFEGATNLWNFFRKFVLDLRVNGVDAQTSLEVSNTGELLPINGPDNNAAFHNPALRNNYTWISSNSNILEVNSYGVLLAKSSGIVTIQAIYNHHQRWRSFIEIEVILLNNGEPIFLQVGMDSGGKIGTEVSSQKGLPIPVHLNPWVTLHEDNTRFITLGNDSPTLDTRNFNWFSRNISVATVSIDGLITGIRFGTVVIEGVYQNNPQFVARFEVSIICVNHIFTRAEQGDHNWHFLICDCGYFKAEPHRFTQFGILMVCSVCGFVIQLSWFVMKEEDYGPDYDK